MSRTSMICRHAERDGIETDLRAGSPYRDIARRHSVSKDALSRHRANHMSRLTATGLAAGKEIMAILNRAETAVSWEFDPADDPRGAPLRGRADDAQLDGAGITDGCAGPEYK
jgi:hypothetical protein